MEDIIKLGKLYDFYGELLTDHQKEIYEDLVYHDLSVSEIAQDHGISRQGAYDLIKRINNILSNYEAKLGLVSRFDNIKQQVECNDKLTTQEKDLILGQL